MNIKYLILLSILIFFLGCDKKEKSSEANEVSKNNINYIINKKQKIKKNDSFKIKDGNLSLEFKNNKLIYPKEVVILLFYNDKIYSKEEELILKRLGLKFYKTNNKFLKEYFNIRYYPTIVILKNNKTIKYENFTPYEILKAEGF